jgi:hypothetical protein
LAHSIIEPSAVTALDKQLPRPKFLFAVAMKPKSKFFQILVCSTVVLITCWMLAARVTTSCLCQPQA